MPRLKRRAWIAGLGVAGLIGLGVTIADAQTDEGPQGFDPLSTEEEATAVGLAQGSNPAETTGLGDDDVVLLVERHVEAKADEADGRRRADVYVYSYDDDRLTLTVVDTATGEADQSTVLANTQLPLLAEEADRAIELALADPGSASALATAYRQATGRELTDPATQLEVQALIFRADGNPAVSRAAADCGRHRCAQLMIQTPDDLLVNIFPVIDLSAERVASRTGDFA